MEDQALLKLYREYLSEVLEVHSDSHLNDYDIAHKFSYDTRYKVSFQDGVSTITDSLTGTSTSIKKTSGIYVTEVQGVFKVIDENDNFYYVDIHGKKVNLTHYLSYRVGDDRSIKSLPLIRKKKVFGEGEVFFNDVKNQYEDAILSPLSFLVSYYYGPHDDFYTERTIPIESSDYVLFSSNEGDVYIYHKALSVYQPLIYDKRERLDARFNLNKDILKINNTYYYVTSYDAIDVTHLFEHVTWSPEITMKMLTSNVLSFDRFKTEFSKNKDFMQLLRQRIKEEKTLKAKSDVDEAKRKEEDDKKHRISDRRKKILLQIKDLLAELDELNREYAVDAENIPIDSDILLIHVGDHMEINPLFLRSLGSIDLGFVSFKNVKVSGVDFSNTNAHINPQEVYNKDMSNSHFRGLNFTISDFTGVDITNSDFTDCNMDFANLTGAIINEFTILPDQDVSIK